MTKQEKQVIAKIALKNKNTKIGQKLAKIIAGIDFDFTYDYEKDGLTKILKKVDENLNNLMENSLESIPSEEEAEEYGGVDVFIEQVEDQVWHVAIENVSEEDNKEVEKIIKKIKSVKGEYHLEAYVSDIEYNSKKKQFHLQLGIK